ncbi:putative transcription termination factor Rho, partial [Dictyocaulus viviparus]
LNEENERRRRYHYRKRDGFGFLRSASANYAPSADDVYISNGQVKKFNLCTGDMVCGEIGPPSDKERYFTLTKVQSINATEVSELRKYVNFDNLLPLYPEERLILENNSCVDNKKDISMRAADIVAPLGKGQRALIVAPPRTGKKISLQQMAHSIATNHPEIELPVLLTDERPEEVTDMIRSVKVIPSSGKVLTDGVDSNALQRPKRFFGAARNIGNGGSSTIIATALVETGSKMDEVIFEEFKGTGNDEVILDRKLADKRIFPAIDITKSGTRKEELLIHKAILNKIWVLRRILNPMRSVEAMGFLRDKLLLTKSNADFFNFVSN